MSISDRENEFLMFYMQETSEEMRHVEQLRATVSSLIITLVTLTAGFIVLQDFKPGTEILASFVIVLGLFGAIMTRKLYEIHQSGQERLDQWYDYIEENIPGSEVSKRRNIADMIHAQNFPILTRVPHNYFWLTFHLLISSAGTILLMLILM